MAKDNKKKTASKKWEETLKTVWQKARPFLKKFFKILWKIPVFPYKLICRLLKWLFIEKLEITLKVLPGLLIVLVMQGLEFTGWGEGLLNGTFDRFIRLDANKAVKQDADMGNIFLVDIGHNREISKNTNLKISYISPRDTIGSLVKMAVDGGAEVVVLDFFFEEHDCCNPGRDDALRSILAKNKSRTKLIFPVNVGQNKTLKPLIFDEEIDNNPNYIRAIPTILASQSDCKVRYWKAYQEYGAKEKKILWSIPVLSAVIHAGKMKELKKLEQEMIKPGKRTGVYPIYLSREKSKKFLLPIGDYNLYLQRIRCRLIPKDCIDSYRAGNTRLPTIEHLTPARFKNKIVIIGNSDLDVGDTHITPVGNMPGMFIHGNALHTLLKGFQPRRLPWLISILINTIILVGAVYILHKLDSFLANLLGMVLGFSIFWFIIYFCLFWDLKMFPNFALGIAGIGIMESIYSLRDFTAKMKKKAESREVSG